MIKLKSLIKEEKEAFRLQREGKIEFRHNTSHHTQYGKNGYDGHDIRIYNRDDLVHSIGVIGLLLHTPFEELGSTPARPRYMFVDFIQVEVEREGYGFLLYKEALIFAQKNKYNGLVSSKTHRTSDADRVWDKIKTSSDKYYDYLDIKDLNTRIKETLLEKKKLDPENKVEDAAEQIIRVTWKMMPSDDKFDEYQVSMWMDNDSSLNSLKDRMAKKFFPNDESYIDKFDNIISSQLDDLEKEHQGRMIKRINSNDPLYILKGICRGKKFEGAKQALIKNNLSNWGYKGGKIGDDEAEEIFNRLYKNAMGETVYDETRANWYGRLSDLHKTKIIGKPEDNIKDYSINLFIDHYTNYKGDKFPDKVKVYRGVNSPLAEIRAGDYVTFDKSYAYDYARGKYGSVVSNILDPKDLYVYKIDIGTSELVYWPPGHKIKKYEGEIPTFKQFWHQVNYEGF